MLSAIINRLSLSEVSKEQILGLLSKIQVLERTGRYKKLLESLEKSNDQANFIAAVLEATIAYQFESAEICLQHEERQDDTQKSSIDFHWKTKFGKDIYIEVRLCQQDDETRKSIAEQLNKHNMYKVTINEDSEKQNITRIQGVIRDKIAKKDGTLNKFHKCDSNIINIVAIDATRTIWGRFDLDDCRLVAFGDSAVTEVSQRQIDGIFQQPKQEDTPDVKKHLQQFHEARIRLHGIIFLFKIPSKEPLNYIIGQYPLWNPALMQVSTSIDICNEIEAALPLVNFVG